jgi:hypothetical protein
MGKADDFIDDYIHHQVMLERYKTGRSAYVLRKIREANLFIARIVKKYKSVETKAQYRRLSKEVKEQTVLLRKKLLKWLGKEMTGLIEEETDFIRNVSGGELKEKPNGKKVLGEILFDTFSDTDTPESYFTALAERIFKVWDGQLRIAYFSKITADDIIFTVLGKKV